MKIAESQLRSIIRETLLKEQRSRYRPGGDVAPGSVYGSREARSQTPGQGREVIRREEFLSSRAGPPSSISLMSGLRSVLGFIRDTAISMTPYGLYEDIEFMVDALKSQNPKMVAIAGIGFIPGLDQIIARPFKKLFRHHNEAGYEELARRHRGERLPGTARLSPEELARTEAEVQEIMTAWYGSGIDQEYLDRIERTLAQKDSAARRMIIDQLDNLDVWRGTRRGPRWRLNGGRRSTVYGDNSGRKIVVVEFENGGKKLFYRSTGTSMPFTSDLNGLFLPFNGFGVLPPPGPPHLWYHKDDFLVRDPSSLRFGRHDKVPDPGTVYRDIGEELKAMDTTGSLSIKSDSVFQDAAGNLVEPGRGELLTLSDLQQMERANTVFRQEGVNIGLDYDEGTVWKPGINGTAEQIWDAINRGYRTPPAR